VKSFGGNIHLVWDQKKGYLGLTNFSLFYKLARALSCKELEVSLLALRGWISTFPFGRENVHPKLPYFPLWQSEN
jgi:hypothetical protein